LNPERRCARYFRGEKRERDIFVHYHTNAEKKNKRGYATLLLVRARKKRVLRTSWVNELTKKEGGKRVRPYSSALRGKKAKWCVQLTRKEGRQTLHFPVRSKKEGRKRGKTILAWVREEKKWTSLLLPVKTQERGGPYHLYLSTRKSGRKANSRGREKLLYFSSRGWRRKRKEEFASHQSSKKKGKKGKLSTPLGKNTRD